MGNRKLKNRLKLASYFNELGFKKGAEIGVYRGYYSKVLCEAIPELKLYCIDMWKVYSGYRHDKRPGKMDQLYKQATESLTPYNAILIQKSSMEALEDIPDNSLDFVYIDANHHYKYVKQDIQEWTKKVRIGGIVAGDDYYVFPSGNDGIIRAVNEFTDKHGVQRQIIDWDLSLTKNDDRTPQWFFFKVKDYR